MLETFHATIVGKFAPLTIMNDADADIDLMITTFNTAVTETVSKILGKHCQTKKAGSPPKFLNCTLKGENWEREKRLKPEGSEKYNEMNNNIKRYMKKAEENWVVEQCSEV